MQVGGLGDVVTGLARACLERGHDVEVLLPFYECLPTDQIEGLQHDMDFDCPKVRLKNEDGCMSDCLRWPVDISQTLRMRVCQSCALLCSFGEKVVRVANVAVCCDSVNTCQSRVQDTGEGLTAALYRSLLGT